MSVYNQEYNKDNVVLRYIIVSLLAELKDKIYYYDRISETETVRHNVPFIYSISGNERFLQDNFVYDNLEEGKAIGKDNKKMTQYDRLCRIKKTQSNLMSMQGSHEG